MAELSRNSKDSKDWSRFDLDAYRITIHNQSPQNFFSYNPTQLRSNLNPNILTSPSPNDSLSDATYRLLQYIKLVSMSYPGSESVILDANRELLCPIGFEELRGTILRTHFSLPFLIAYDSTRRAQPDLRLTNDDLTILLIVQLRDPTDPLTGSTGWDPEARAVASAIAAFCFNNAYRDGSGLSQLGSMTIPAITVNRTGCWFYKIHVTEELSHDVRRGRVSDEGGGDG